MCSYSCYHPKLTYHDTIWATPHGGFQQVARRYRPLAILDLIRVEPQHVFLTDLDFRAGLN